MKTFLGWIVSASLIYMAANLSGDITIFIDLQMFIVIFPFIYGMTTVIFGFSKTLKSIKGVRILFIDAYHKDPDLSSVYKTQIVLSIIIGVILSLIGFIAIGSNSDGVQFLGPSLSVNFLALLYPALLSGLIYYPLYKKMTLL